MSDDDLRALVQRLREYAAGERMFGYAAQGDAMAAAADELESLLARAEGVEYTLRDINDALRIAMKDDIEGMERERIELLLARAEAAEAECARLRQDAERYRWLRNSDEANIAATWFLPTDAAMTGSPEEIDAAIDRAIAEGKHEAG